MSMSWTIVDNRYLFKINYDGYLLLGCPNCGAQERVNYLDSDPQVEIDSEIVSIIASHLCL